MNEARQLDPEVMPPTATPSSSPASATPPVIAPASTRDVVPISASLAPRTKDKTSLIEPRTRTAQRLESTSRSLLVYFVIGLLAFAAGAAMASAMLFGWLDLEWVKDALKSVKDLVRTVMSSGS